MKYEARKEKARDLINKELKDNKMGINLFKLFYDVFESTAMGEIFVMKYLRLLEANGKVILDERKVTLMQYGEQNDTNQ